MTRLGISKIKHTKKSNKKGEKKHIKRKLISNGVVTLIFAIVYIGLGKLKASRGLTVHLCFSMVTADPGQLPGYVCRPQMSSRSSDEDNFRQIECEISTCKVSKVTYEKKMIASQWIPVFEGINKTHFRTLNTGKYNYSMTNRNDYGTLYTKHLLFIKPLILKDQGEWRCVVHDENSGDCESNSVEVNIYVTPASESIAIRPSYQYMVTHHRYPFTCTVNGIHPEPEVVWIVNAAEHNDGIASNRRNETGLWMINNTIILTFAKAGLNNIICMMRSTIKYDWIQNKHSIDVKASARILHPQEDMMFTVNMNDIFTLKCNGSGFHPNLSWGKDGSDIMDTDSRFSTKRICNVSTCEGVLTFNPIDLDLFCVNSEHLLGVYTCAITLEPPYKSSTTSPIMTVRQSGTQCNTDHHEMTKRMLIIWAPLAISITVIIGCVCIRCNTKNRRRIYLQCLKTFGIEPNNHGNIELQWKYTKLQVSLQQLPVVPTFVKCVGTLAIEESLSSIWTSLPSNKVFVGGRTRPSLTVIDPVNVFRRIQVSTLGTYIVNGFAISEESHLLNVYHHKPDIDTNSHNYTLVYVQIDATATKLLSPKSTLNLSENEYAVSICSIDETTIAVYSINDHQVCTPKIHKFFLSDIRAISNPTPIESIVLDGLTQGDQHDSVCVSANGNICVLSWLDNKVYVHKQNGCFLSSFGCAKRFSGLDNPGYLFEPCHIESFIDNSLIIMCKHSIHRYRADKMWEFIKQNNDRGVYKAAFTKPYLLCICADDQTQIQVFSMNYENNRR